MKKENKHQRRVTMPVPDTIPGPGNYSMNIIDFDQEGEIPVADIADLAAFEGYGTAFDISSALRAPDPDLGAEEDDAKS